MRQPKKTQKIHLIDTNIILRYLIGDDPEKAARAVALMERVEDGLQDIEIPSVVVAEIILTLEKFYNVPREEIADKLLTIFSFNGVQGYEKKIIVKALNSYISKRIDFVDCFLAARSVEKKTAIY
ncbi:MAG: PIN domain-containing protein, partial [Nitrospirota bacterium]